MITEIIKVDLNNIEASRGELMRAGEMIKNGGLVVFPTETVYGLGGDGTNPRAAKKIFEAKGRPSDNPLIVHIAEPAEAEKYAETNELYYKLANKYMPGPLTVILKSKDTIPGETKGGLDTVAVRCPENPIARELIRLSGVPIAAPSANLSGSPSPTSATHVIDDMMGRVDMIIDGGKCEFGLESTIVKIEDENTVILLRPGKITAEELSRLCDVKIAEAVTAKLADGAKALSPGMKYRHYAPKSPLILLDGDKIEQIKFIKKENLKNTAAIVYSEDVIEFKKEIPDVKLYDLGALSDECSQAHNLFAILRDADKWNYTKIYAPLPKQKGIALALYNRMIRAAAYTIIDLRH